MLLQTSCTLGTGGEQGGTTHTVSPDQGLPRLVPFNLSLDVTWEVTLIIIHLDTLRFHFMCARKVTGNRWIDRSARLLAVPWNVRYSLSLG